LLFLDARATIIIEEWQQRTAKMGINCNSFYLTDEWKARYLSLTNDR
jgi:hypothetical protein